MAKQNPRKDGVRFGANAEIVKSKKEVKEKAEKQIDTAQEIADLAWSINFKEQMGPHLYDAVQQTIIEVKKSEQNEN